MTFIAPFIALSDEEDHEMVMGLYGFEGLDRLGASTLGNLCFNTESRSLGLIRGYHTNHLDIAVRRLVNSYLIHQEAEALIFYANNNAPIATPCSLTEPSSKIYISPSKVAMTCHPYVALGCPVLPLTLDSDNMTLKHVLEIFTPRGDSSEERQILIRMQHIVDQLEEPFNLQRLNELIEREEWNATAASFITLRRSLLSRLLSGSAGRNEATISTHRETIVDLTDPILSSTHLDTVLMDITLRKFLRDVGRRKIIVFYDSEELLKPGSSIAKSLEWLASLGNARPASIIIATTDHTHLPSKLLNSVDYFLRGMSHSAIPLQVPEDFTLNVDPHSFNTETISVWSPSSLIFESSTEVGRFEKPWLQECAAIDIDLLKYPKSPLVTETLPSRELRIDSSPHSTGLSESTSKSPSVQDAPSFTIHSSTAQQSSNSSQVAGMLSNAAMEIPDNLPRGEEKLDRVKNTILAMIGEIHEKQHNVPHSHGSTNKASSAGPSPSIRYKELVRGIEKLTGGQAGGWVNYDAIGRTLGGNKGIRKLGFEGYTAMMKAASDEKFIILRSEANNVQYVRLASSGRGSSTSAQPSKPHNTKNARHKPSTKNSRG